MAFSIRPYARALYEAAAGKTGAETKQLTENVLDMLAEKGLLRRSPELIAEIERLDDQASGRLRARIRSAHRLDEATLAKIGQMLRKRTGASEIVWEKEVDHALLGGVVIAYGDTVLDMSLARAVESLAEEIKK